MIGSRRVLIILTAIAVTLAAFVAMGEATVRVAAHLVRRGQPDYADTMNGGLLRPGFSSDVIGGDGSPVLWTNNAAGFRSTREFAREPPPETLRILSLGDSFTAGYRVGNEETFSRQLEIWLAETARPAEVLVNGIEEPDNGLRYLRETGVSWSPHVLLVGITLGNDIAQAYVSRNPQPIGFRNGLENLVLPPESLAEATTVSWLAREVRYASLRSRLLSLFRPRRAITSWYGHAYPPRLFDPINGFGMFLADPPVEIDVAYDRLFAILDETAATAESRGIHPIVAVFPQRYQIQPGDWTAAQAAYGLDAEAFDLDRPNRRIAEYCRERRLDCVDPTEYMRREHASTGEVYYQPLGDMHWNAAGHRVWLDGAKPDLLRMIAPIALRIGSATP